jgi:PiT family inorganic phosphate transporter
MADMATLVQELPARTKSSAEPSLLDRKLTQPTSRKGIALFFAVAAAALAYIAVHLGEDLDHASIVGVAPYLMLGLALTIALGFEFVNGFHDTANAVATVIYTHSLPPTVAVVWSGICNLAGVLFSSGAVAFAIVMLLPIELVLQVSSGSGYSMVFALLLAAILWNLATWYLGLPASSSHTMVGSIIGVGVANQLLNLHDGTSGLDWQQAVKVLKALFFSPIIGFTVAALLLLASKMTLRFPSLFEAPKNDEPPSLPIRLLMILTCTGVSFYHGSNDGQKGMGLIMLILIGTVPTAYALNHNVTAQDIQSFIAASEQAGHILDQRVDPNGALGVDARAEVTNYISSKQLQPDTVLALRKLVEDINHEVAFYKGYKNLPASEQTKVRNDMYVSSEALRLMLKDGNPQFNREEKAALGVYRTQVDKATRFIPRWVMVATALALGLGTMVGWKRIVITVGERIGKQQLTYAQGASSGLVTMGAIFAADKFGLPVSTTHILSSGIAGSMAANGSGLRMVTVRNIAAGWVCTLPAAALLSGLLFWLFHSLA